MRSLFISLFLIGSASFLTAAENQASFVLMPAYWYGYHWEETPDALAKFSQRQLVVTGAYRLPFGLALGATWLQNTSYQQDSRVLLSGQGPSLGFVGMDYISAFYTFLYKPKLDYDFPTLGASASYFDGSGSIVDLGLHFGNSWLRFGPRVLLIDVSYRKSRIASELETETLPLEGSPWRDRWLEPYLGLWLLF